MADKQQNDGGLRRYQEVTVPSGIHIGIKLWVFQLVDIAVIGFAFLLASRLTTIIVMRPFFAVMTYIVVIGIAVFGVMRTSLNPTERNYKTIIYALMYRQRHYKALDTQEINQDWGNYFESGKKME